MMVFLASPAIVVAGAGALLLSLVLLAVHGINQRGWVRFSGWTLLVWLAVSSFGIILMTLPVGAISVFCLEDGRCIVQTTHGWPFPWLLLTAGGPETAYSLDALAFVGEAALWAGISLIGALAVVGLALREPRPIAAAATPSDPA